MVNYIKIIAQSSFTLILGNIINQILILTIGLFSARYLGPSDYGIIAFASSLNFIFIISLDLGFHQYIIRQISKDKDSARYYIVEFTKFKILLSFPLIIFIILFLTVFQYNYIVIIVTLITTLAYILNSFIYSLYSVLQAYLEMRFISISQILNGLLVFFGLSVSILIKADIIYFALVPLISNVIIIFYCFSRIRKLFLQINFSFNFNFIRKHLANAIPFGLTGFFVTIYFWSNSFWLSLFYGVDQVGLFNVAFKLILALFTISQAINMITFPLLSKLYDKNKSTAKMIYEKQIKFMLIISAPISIILTFVAPYLILNLLGETYSSSIIVLSIITWVIPFVFVRSAFERLLEISNNQIKVTQAYGIGVILNTALNIFLIYYFDIIGAALSLLLTDITIFIVLLFYSVKINLGIDRVKKFFELLKIIIASLFMIFIIIYLLEIKINLLLSIMLGGLSFIVILIVIKGIEKSDFKITEVP